ncbi:uncharacterized protein LOC114533821 [Dendronephthya gigantea]|uniref:uncharacterized protein LOC114533821 n=1 Tax=Dendronephthya gigantea TaxID=151771 RepID=UPI00106CD801|nr:uncharacterized protein LOC114533821 [Dendronephthya gigantea]
MANKQSDEISMPEMATFPKADSTNTLLTRKFKKRFSADLCWKIIITLAVIIIACFIIYKEVHEEKSSTKTKLSSPKSGKSSREDEGRETTDKTILDCTSGSIKSSEATFTFQPYNSKQPYTTHGMEFKFEVIKKKPGIEKEVTKLQGVRYYYNVARCKIGGGVQVDKKPFIRGPLVFAIDEQCTKAYYFLSGWKEYRSARNLKCSAREEDKKEVTESDCLDGSIEGSNSSFIYLPFGATKLYRASGVEFSFETIVKKTKLGSRLTKLNETMASTPKVHYYYNIPRCRIGGGTQLDKKPIIRGPLVFAVDEVCGDAYYFTEGVGWHRYVSAKNISCSKHGNASCFEGSLQSYAKFKYVSSKTSSKVGVTGIQYNLTKLLDKIRLLTTDYHGVAKIPELAGEGHSYYLNLHRCYNGGPVNFQIDPPIGGPIIFAINNECSRAYYLGANPVRWNPYGSGSDIKCGSRKF